MISRHNIRIKDPILHAPICLFGCTLSFLPRFLDIFNQPILLLGLFRVDLVALLGQVVLELLWVPFRVRDYYFGIPVRLDNLYKVLPICRFGIR